MGKLIDLTGKRFGRLTVIKRGPNVNKKNQNRPQWYCKCDCGTIKLIDGSALKRKYTISCGCSKITHGDTNTKFYSVWDAIKQRCFNPNNQFYHHYGGRGITICNRWLIYENFKEDMYKSYLDHHKKHNGDTSIDRINNNGNYEPFNCKWSTQREQILNSRQTYEFIGIYKNGYREISSNQTEFAIRHNLDSTLISRCVRGRRKQHKGWTFKRILMEDKN